MSSRSFKTLKEAITSYAGSKDPFNNALEWTAYAKTMSLGAPGLDGLREALIKPAWVRGFELESDALANAIIEDVGLKGTPLPVLSIVMQQLFSHAEEQLKTKQTDKRVITSKSFEEIGKEEKEDKGGVTGVYCKLGNDFYNQLSPKDQSAVQHLFLRMLERDGQEFDYLFKPRKVYVDKGTSLTNEPYLKEMALDEFVSPEVLESHKASSENIGGKSTPSGLLAKAFLASVIKLCGLE